MKGVWACLIVLSAFVCGCSGNRKEWTEISASGIGGPGHENFNDFFFLDSQNAVMLGSYLSKDDVIHYRLQNVQSELYVSNDGCLNWSKKSFGRGEFTAQTSKDGFAFVAQKITNTDSPRAYIDSSKIYFSEKLGQNWVQISSIKNFFVRDIFSITKNEIYIIGNSEHDGPFWTLKKSIDQGSHWETIAKLDNEMISPVERDRSIFYIKGGIRNSIFRFSLSTGVNEKFEINNDVTSHDVSPYFINSYKGTIYITGKTKKGIVIIKANPDLDKFELIAQWKDADEFPIRLYGYDGGLALITGIRNSIGVLIYLTVLDMGKNTWHQTPMPTASFDPITFTGNEIWGYWLIGKFYKKRLFVK